MYLLEARELGRSFKVGNSTIDVLNNVNAGIESGTFNVFMGPSGSGKTTLLNLMGALDMPDKGKVLYKGDDITAMSENKRDSLRRSRYGFVFQSIALVSNMTAFENVDFALRIHGFDRKERRKRAEECLDYVDLRKRMRHKPFELSGGEQQRVAIARAIAHRPELLLADEPTAELDTNTGLRIVKLFKDLVSKGKITVIMCTHDVNMMEVADRIFVLENGVLQIA